MTIDAGLAPPAAEPPIEYAPPPRPLRLWFPVAMVGAYWAYQLIWQRLELVTFVRFIGRTLPIVLLVLTLAVWWLTRKSFSRRARWGIAGVFVLVAVATAMLTRETFGPVGVIFTAAPWALTAAVVWLLAARRASHRTRLTGLVATIVAAWLAFTTLRLEGLWGEQEAQYSWRWTPSAESLYLAERGTVGAAGGATSVPTTSQAQFAARLGRQDVVPWDSPGYLGASRDGVVRGVSLPDDWAARPPKLLWRRRVGPAWSSVAVVRDRLYTQEQQGELEAVTCIDAASGAELWAHQDRARFWESVAGAGPRATPTYWKGRVYAVGGTGVLNCLDADTGTHVWTRDILSDAGAPLPMWGVSGSPAVTDAAGGLVIVYAGGDQGRSLLAYRAGDGAIAWTAQAGTMSYASPQPARLVNTDQVVMLSERGLASFDPATGTQLWEHVALVPQAPRSVQPVVIHPSHLLMASEADIGVAMLDVGRDSAFRWTVHPRWSSKKLKPSFSHVVARKGHAYGFDGSIFCCVDLGTGERKWKSGRYGRGQVLLVEDSNHLLVLAEDGRVVLLRTNPERHEELGEFQAINGKTWNHPVLTRDRLYVRNAEEMACYEVTQATGAK